MYQIGDRVRCLVDKDDVQYEFDENAFKSLMGF